MLNLTKEDEEFLLKLKKDLINGDHVCQAFPRYWMIMDYQNLPVPEGYEADEVVYYCDGDSFTLDDIKEHIIEELENEEHKKLVLNANNFDYLEEIIQKNHIDFDLERYDRIELKEKRFLSPFSGAFLTKEDAQKHLDDNHYHYSYKAHTYALTAFRNPRFERLMKIIEKLEVINNE